ncbi:Methionyl-tRNA formyltransferase [Geodia barretti]|uniref:Methionyl-tRNA formyltransferase, mitochondrial n=2 Tax=Geodia barretti TaxID=519541 RepID=A0AA35T5T4_GEOBA|nr:Methionyl-tRNA formyltransferase [Geodia barretti]
MGTPSSVVPVLGRLLQMPDVDVLAAVTPPDRPRGRGRQPESPPVKDAASSLGIPVLQPPTLRRESVQADLAALSPDVIVVAAYGRLLPSSVLQIPPHGCLNLHPSLLPRHRGPSPVATSILEGDETTGITLMLLDEGMDTGPLVAQREYALEGTETAGDLTDLLFNMGADLLAENLESWTRGELKAGAQDETAATVSSKLERTDGLADWMLPASTLVRQCRAFSPWPGLYTEWEGKTLKVLEAEPMGDLVPAGAGPGNVVGGASGQRLSVATGQGMLALNRVQLEGRRAVTSEEFLRGYPEIVGARLGSQETKS